jgi:hypothetical protein
MATSQDPGIRSLSLWAYIISVENNWDLAILSQTYQTQWRTLAPTKEEKKKLWQNGQRKSHS